MTRKKVKLMWIVNDAARKASLKKRRVGLLKKVSELTILCGIEAFIIIYSPDDPEPAVWPSRPEVQRLLTRFQNMPDMERYKKMMNQESYLKERMGKLNEQSRKHMKKNRELELAGLMQQVYQENGFDSLDQNQLGGLTWLVEEKMKELRKRIEYFQQIPPLQPGVVSPPVPFPPRQDPNNDDDDGGRDVDNGTGGEPGDGRNHPTEGGASWDQWFTDMINNPEHYVAGGSSTKSDDFRSPHPFCIAGARFGGGGPDFRFHPGPHDHGGGSSSSGNIFGLGLSNNRNMGGGISGGHNFDLGLLPYENEILRGSSSASGGNNFDLGMPFGSNMTGGSSAGKSSRRGLGGDNSTVGHNFDLGLPLGNTDMGGGNSSGGNNFDPWPPHMINNVAAVNNFDPWLSRGDMGGENLVLGLLPGSNFTGSSGTSAGGNPFPGLQGMHRRDYSGGGASSAGGSDLGLPAGIFGAGSSDIGLPFNITKTWPNNNFNP